MLLATIGRHLAHNAVAYLALVVATSGTAYAAATIGSAEVIDNSLRSVDVSNDSATGGGLGGVDIRNDTLTGVDIQEQSLAKVPNADTVDGLDSSAFVQGPGAVYRGAVALPAGAGAAGWTAFIHTSDPDVTLGYNCPADLNQNGILIFRNDSAGLVNVFSDNGSTNPDYQQVGAGGGRWDQYAAATGEHITFQVQGDGPHIVTIEVFSVHRGASQDCHVQAVATVGR